jgi:hypothetical protein
VTAPELPPRYNAATKPGRVTDPDRRRLQGVTCPRALARIAGTVLIALAAATYAAGPVAADHGGQRQTFAEIVDQAQVIVLARVSIGPAGGIVLDVERTLKGNPVGRLAFAPTDIAPLNNWDRAIVAFTDPTTIDFRTPTIAWHVADDGTIDPEGFQQFPGLPTTLDAMLVAFGQDPNDSPAASDGVSLATAEVPPGDGSQTVIATVIAGAAATGLLAFLIVRRWRRAQ